MPLGETLLDRTIAPGYERYGLALRRRMSGWPADPPRMDGRVVLVTGAASGIGQAAAQGFALLGAKVLAVAHNQQRARDAEAALSGDVEGDAGDGASVRALRELAAGLGHVDVVVNNAGVMPAERSRSVDGVELTFAPTRWGRGCSCRSSAHASSG
jgi:NADPH:quinone reductase-like Zn-dependent oxidoreductase